MKAAGISRSVRLGTLVVLSGCFVFQNIGCLGLNANQLIVIREVPAVIRDTVFFILDSTLVELTR